MADAWQDRVQFVADGEAVAASVTNRPLATLAERDQYLKSRLDAAGLGESVRAFGAVLAASVLPDMPVAYNTSTQQFEPALAGVRVDPGTGQLYPGNLADCVGVCTDKQTPTFGTVVTSGRYPTTLTSAVVQPTAPGRYYLSPSVPGALVLERPAVAVPVLYYDGTYAYVAPALHDFLESHVHFRHALTCAAAGTATGVSTITITSPNPNLAGWLPASHAVFGGHAPVGAKFGYNLAQDASLALVWPPTPLQSVVFAWKNFGDVGASVLTSVHVVADQYGIWWMTNGSDDVPWPMAGTSLSGETMSLIVSFTEMLFETSKAVVTDLHAVPGSPIKVVDCVGNPATAGSLYLDLDMTFLTAPDTVNGSLVFKSLDGLTFHRGKVLEGLVAGSNITLTPTNPADVAVIAGQTVVQGIATVDANVNLADRELVPQVIRLYDAVERPYQGILYIGFPINRKSSITMKFQVPYAGLPASPHVELRATLLALAGGTLPVTTLSYRTLARPAGSPVSLPSTDTAVTWNSNVACGANQYVEVTSAPIVVSPGDTLFVTLTRNTSDGYTGEVGVVRLGGVLVTA